MFGDMIRKIPPVHVYGTPVAAERERVDISSRRPKHFEHPSSLESLSPAIDGPPSPERIRAYTEAMRRATIFGDDSRTGTLSSISSENATLSRQSSFRSNSSNMGHTRPHRPESIQILSSMFSRNGRKMKREHSMESSSRSTLSINTTSAFDEEESAKEYHFGKKGSRTRKTISAPMDFRHITHTGKDHLPDLHRKNRTELASEFSAMRASQVPTHGELKGIRATDLHFENFSSEALSTSTGESRRQTVRNPRRPSTARTPSSPLRAVNVTKSHESLRAAPPRPPRSPLSPPCPRTLPARTSSRTASVLFDQFDPFATANIERPYTSGSFRKPSPFHLPMPSKSPANEDQHKTTEEIVSYAITTPGDEAWPLATAVSVSSGHNLTDVQEEEEDYFLRPVRLSIELRTSQSTPALRHISQEKATHARMPSNATVLSANGSVLADTELHNDDSWEQDIDWCYDNEVEADCDYQWDQCSDENSSDKTATIPTTVQPTLDLKVQDDERTYKGSFRPSLLIPSPRDLQQFSPSSNASTPFSDIKTPGLLPPKHARSSSRASSFKECHGFNLSPTLLIPTDFHSQMEQDDVYQAQFIQDTVPGPIFNHGSFSLPFASIEESESSTASYRSSNLSSSTRMSYATSRGSQDSMILLSQAAMISKAHRSIGSASSLPDLVYPSRKKSYGSDLGHNMSSLSIEDDSPRSALPSDLAGSSSSLASLQQRRRKSLAPTITLASENGAGEELPSIPLLTPVPEMFPAVPLADSPRRAIHGRKSSAPISASVREVKGRARSSTISTGKARTSYALFPQI